VCVTGKLLLAMHSIIKCVGLLVAAASRSDVTIVVACIYHYLALAEHAACQCLPAYAAISYALLSSEIGIH
jgi:hypothetical protein